MYEKKIQRERKRDGSWCVVVFFSFLSCLQICGLLPDSFSLVPLSGGFSGSLLCLSPDTVTVFDINEGTGDTSTARSIAIATASCVGGEDPSNPSKGILFPGDVDLSVKNRSKTSPPTTTTTTSLQAPLNESLSEKKKKTSIFEERTNLNKMLRRGYVRGGGMTHIVNSAGMLRTDLTSLPTVLFNQSELQVDLRDCLAEVLGDHCCLFILRDTGRFLLAHFVSLHQEKGGEWSIKPTYLSLEQRRHRFDI